jgi:hypothetical protein
MMNLLQVAVIPPSGDLIRSVRIDVRPEPTDEEREAILQAIVGRVEMQEKETGTCELAFLPQVPDYRLDDPPPI